jgi:hypothetical protein
MPTSVYGRHFSDMEPRPTGVRYVTKADLRHPFQVYGFTSCEVTVTVTVRRRPDQVAARLMKIGSQYSALADTGRSPDEIIGYDDQGLPR